jgi:ribosomal protein L34
MKASQNSFDRSTREHVRPQEFRSRMAATAGRSSAKDENQIFP